MKITTFDGKKEIDVSEYLTQMCENHRLGRDVREQTPIGQNADGDYFWWDEKKNPKLNKRSVNKLIKFVMSQNEVQS